MRLWVRKKIANNQQYGLLAIFVLPIFPTFSPFPAVNFISFGAKRECITEFNKWMDEKYNNFIFLYLY